MFDLVNKRYIEWSDIDYRCQEILKNCGYNNKEYELVVGIARGGMVPATLLSYGLDVPMRALYVSTFSNGERKGINDATDAETKKLLKNYKVLIVDDIYDTGQTAEYIEKEYPNADFIPLFDKRLEDPENKYWYVFPWDTDYVEKVY